MQAGNLRRRVVLQRRDTTQDATTGQQAITWTTLQTIWADIEPLYGQQLAKAMSIYNEVSHRVIVRWQALFEDIKQVGSYRLTYTWAGVTRIFDIGAVMNDAERNRQVTLLCTEGINDGQ